MAITLFPEALKTKRTSTQSDVDRVRQTTYRDGEGNLICERCAWVLAYHERPIRIALVSPRSSLQCQRCRESIRWRPFGDD